MITELWAGISGRSLSDAPNGPPAGVRPIVVHIHVQELSGPIASCLCDPFFGRSALAGGHVNAVVAWVHLHALVSYRVTDLAPHGRCIR